MEESKKKKKESDLVGEALKEGEKIVTGEGLRAVSKGASRLAAKPLMNTVLKSLPSMKVGKTLKAGVGSGLKGVPGVAGGLASMGVATLLADMIFPESTARDPKEQAEWDKKHPEENAFQREKRRMEEARERDEKMTDTIMQWDKEKKKAEKALKDKEKKRKEKKAGTSMQREKDKKSPPKETATQREKRQMEEARKRDAEATNRIVRQHEETTRKKAEKRSAPDRDALRGFIKVKIPPMK